MDNVNTTTLVVLFFIFVYAIWIQLYDLGLPMSEKAGKESQYIVLRLEPKESQDLGRTKKRGVIEEEHEDHLRVVLQVLRDHQLYAKFKKCEFWLTEEKILGHVVSATSVSVDPKKVEAVMSWERPKSVFEIQSFLRFVGYYRRFIEYFSRLAAPTTRLTWKEVKFEWNDLCERAF